MRQLLFLSVFETIQRGKNLLPACYSRERYIEPGVGLETPTVKPQTGCKRSAVPKSGGLLRPPP
jgi:hypothetical protein